MHAYCYILLCSIYSPLGYFGHGVVVVHRLWALPCTYIRLSLQAALVRTDAYLVDLDYIGEPHTYFTRLVSLSLCLPVNAPVQSASKGLEYVP